MLCTMCGVNEATLFFTETDMYCSISCKLAAWDVMMDAWDVDADPGKYLPDESTHNVEDPYDFDMFAFIDLDLDSTEDLV